MKHYCEHCEKHCPDCGGSRVEFWEERRTVHDEDRGTYTAVYLVRSCPDCEFHETKEIT